METEDGIAHLKKAGCKITEVFLQTYYEYRPEFAKKYAVRADGMDIHSIHVTTNHFEPQLFHKGNRARGDSYYWLDQLMRSAKLFGAEYYTFHGYQRRAGNEDNYGDISYRLNKVMEFCSEYGVKLCLENVSWGLYNRPGVFREIKKGSYGLCGVFDNKQARRSGFPYQMYINDMAGSITHVHLSDVDANGKMCLPGKGITDFKEMLTRLKDTGFDGPVLIEVYSHNYGGEEELVQSADYLDEIIYKLG